MDTDPSVATPPIAQILCREANSLRQDLVADLPWILGQEAEEIVVMPGGKERGLVGHLDTCYGRGTPERILDHNKS